MAAEHDEIADGNASTDAKPAHSHVAVTEVAMEPRILLVPEKSNFVKTKPLRLRESATTAVASPVGRPPSADGV